MIPPITRGITVLHHRRGFRLANIESRKGIGADGHVVATLADFSENLQIHQPLGIYLRDDRNFSPGVAILNGGARRWTKPGAVVAAITCPVAIGSSLPT